MYAGLSRQPVHGDVELTHLRQDNMTLLFQAVRTWRVLSSLVDAERRGRQAGSRGVKLTWRSLGQISLALTSQAREHDYGDQTYRDTCDALRRHRTLLSSSDRAVYREYSPMVVSVFDGRTLKCYHMVICSRLVTSKKERMETITTTAAACERAQERLDTSVTIMATPEAVWDHLVDARRVEAWFAERAAIDPALPWRSRMLSVAYGRPGNSALPSRLMGWRPS